jgi:hypothetical protein
MTEAPSTLLLAQQEHQAFRLLSGGLRSASTTGYYLTALQAEICIAFSRIRSCQLNQCHKFG